MSDQENPTPEEVRADIEQTRDELGDTVEALAAKADVKAQAKAKVSGVTSSVKDNVTGVADSAKAKAQDFTAQAGDTSPGAATGTAAQAALAHVKANPLPYAVGGALLLGLIIGRR